MGFAWAILDATPLNKFEVHKAFKINDDVLLSDCAGHELVLLLLCLRFSFENVHACHQPLVRGFELLSHYYAGLSAFGAIDPR
jgi:hypothetical protein